MTVKSKSSPKKDEGPKKPSYEDVHKLANALNKASDPEKISEVLKAAAMAQFDPVAADLILVAIQAKTKLPKKPLRQRLQMIQQELGLLPNDLALSIARKILVEHFKDGAHLIRCADRSYMRFIGTHWVETTDEHLEKLIFLEANKIMMHLESGGLAALTSESKRCLNFLLGTDEDMMNFLAEPLPVINCSNGEIWIDENGEVTLSPHLPENRLPFCLPVEFDPDASCPKFDKALLQIFSEADDPEDMARHFVEFLGYSVQPRRDIPSWWLLIGHGSNGKTKLLQTMQKLVSPDAVLNDNISTFQRDRFNVAALAGKLLFIDDDLAEGVMLADGLLKKISEAKELSARHPYGRRKFHFRSLALPILAGNSYPMTNDISPGMIRRTHIIPFDKVFTDKEADPNLFPTIWAEELPGILNRAITGLKGLRKRGGFKLPSDCKRAEFEFFCHANPLAGFIEECCIRDPDAREYLRDMRKVMKVWAKDQGVKRSPAGNILKRKLEGLGYYVGQEDGKSRVHGLALKEGLPDFN